MRSDSELKALLDFDPLDAAEKMTGTSYKDNNSTAFLGMGLSMNHNKRKEAVLAELDDTMFCNRLDRYQRIVESEGFKKVIELDIPEHEHCGELMKGEKFFIYWHEDGMLLAFDTYGKDINSSKLYFNWQPKDTKTWSEARCSGGYIDNETVSGYFDGREALRFHVRQLRNGGKLLAKWRKRPFLWLLHWVDTKTEGYDYKAINAERIAMLPQSVRDAMFAEVR